MNDVWQRILRDWALIMDKKKVLIVDDEQDLLQTMDERLRAAGYDVTTAADGVSAISVAQQEKPDLILLDIGLPAGDGFSVIRRIKSLTPIALTPIFIITALDALANEERSLEAGAKAFFQKPVDIDELLAAIERTLQP